MSDVLGVIRRSEPISDDEFNTWADAMGLATPNRIAVRRALMREYERGQAATTWGAVEALETLWFELEAGNRDSARYAFRQLHSDWIKRLEQMRADRDTGGQ